MPIVSDEYDGILIKCIAIEGRMRYTQFRVISLRTLNLCYNPYDALLGMVSSMTSAMREEGLKKRSNMVWTCEGVSFEV